MREYELDPSSINSSLAALLIRQKIRIVVPRLASFDSQLADLLVQLTDSFPSVGLDRAAAEDSCCLLQQLGLPRRDLRRMDLVVCGNLGPRLLPADRL